MKYALIREDIPDESAGFPDGNYQKRVTNPADASALEFAWILQKKLGGSICVLSMGPPDTAAMLRQAALGGANRLVLLSDPEFAGADTFATAKTLATAAKALGEFDLILCGRRAVDGETGQVGPMLSVFLHLPCLTNVISLDPISTGGLLVSCMGLDDMRTYQISTPALLSVCESHTLGHTPSLQELRASRDLPIEIWTQRDLGITPGASGAAGSLTKVIHSQFQPDSPRKGLRETDPEEGVRVFMRYLSRAT